MKRRPTVDGSSSSTSLAQPQVRFQENAYYKELEEESKALTKIKKMILNQVTLLKAEELTLVEVLEEGKKQLRNLGLSLSDSEDENRNEDIDGHNLHDDFSHLPGGSRYGLPAPQFQPLPSSSFVSSPSGDPIRSHEHNARHSSNTQSNFQQNHHHYSNYNHANLDDQFVESFPYENEGTQAKRKSDAIEGEKRNGDGEDQMDLQYGTFEEDEEEEEERPEREEKVDDEEEEEEEEEEEDPDENEEQSLFQRMKNQKENQIQEFSEDEAFLDD